MAQKKFGNVTLRKVEEHFSEVREGAVVYSFEADVNGETIGTIELRRTNTLSILGAYGRARWFNSKFPSLPFERKQDAVFSLAETSVNFFRATTDQGVAGICSLLISYGCDFTVRRTKVFAKTRTVGWEIDITTDRRGSKQNAERKEATTG